MPITVPILPNGAFFFDYTTSQLWVGTVSGNQLIGIVGNVVLPTNTPTAGQVLTALGATSAAWQTPSAGPVTQIQAVNISAAPPTAGQVLTASDATDAAWVTPASSGVMKTARVDMGTIASATPSLVTAYTWPTPFLDNNYTLVGSVVILETPPAGAATAIVCVGSIELLASGTGFNFVICNADGLPHHVIAQFVAVHD